MRRRERQCACAEVGYFEAHRIFARLVGIVAELNLRAVIVCRYVRPQIRFRIANYVFQTRNARALFTGGIRQAVLVVHRTCRTHRQLHRKTVKLLRVDNTKVFFNIATNKRHKACHIRRCHGRTALFAVTTGNGGSNFPAVRRDFGFQFQIVRGPPRREFTHKRPSRVFAVNLQRTDTVATRRRYELDTRIHTDGNSGNGVVDFPKVHTNNAGYVIVDNDCRRVHRHSNFYLFLERVVATRNQRNTGCSVVKFISYYAVVGNDTYTAQTVAVDPADNDVFKFRAPILFRKCFHEIIRVTVDITGFFKEDVRLIVFPFVCHEIACLLTVDTCNGKRRRERRRRTYRTRIGVGSQVRTVYAAVTRRIVVTCRAHKAYACFLNSIVYVGKGDAFPFFVVGGSEPARSTKRHIDNVNAKLYTVVKRRDNIFGNRTTNVFIIQIVRKYLTDNELRVGNNPLEYFVYGITVFVGITACIITADNTRNVRTVVRIGRIYVCVVVCIVVCKRNFFTQIYVVYGKFARTDFGRQFKFGRI